jgi:hypothetical protein
MKQKIQTTGRAYMIYIFITQKNTEIKQSNMAQVWRKLCDAQTSVVYSGAELCQSVEVQVRKKTAL